MDWLRLGFVWVTVCSIVLVPVVVEGQAARASDGDVVKFKKGGFIRGSIVELVPDDYVVIVATDGTRHRYPMTDVSFAGRDAAPPPAATAPSASPATSTASTVPNKVPVQLEASSDKVSFHIRTGEGRAKAGGYDGYGTYNLTVRSTFYDLLCTAPCTASLPPGSYRFALSQGEDGPIEPEKAIDITGPTSLEGTYISKQGVRTAGWMTTIGGVVAGTALIIAGASATDSNGDWNSTLVMTGLGVSIGSYIAGLIMRNVDDRAEIAVKAP